MAGIEKICEFSGISGGWEMYGYKRDNIQVLPQFRKEFRDKDALLIFFTEPKAVVYSNCGPHAFVRIGKWFIPKVWTRYYWQWKDVRRPYYSMAELQWDFLLYVPQCRGRVAGMYWNTTLNPEKTMTNLTKLCGRLTVTSFASFDEEYMKDVVKKECDEFAQSISGPTYPRLNISVS